MSPDDKRAKTPSSPVPVPSRTTTPQRTARDTSMGAVAVDAWLSARGVFPPSRAWTVSITFDTGERAVFVETIDTRFVLAIQPESWAYTFMHRGRRSHVNVATSPSIGGSDDHLLLASTPSLANIGALLRELERRYNVHFPRHAASVVTDLPGAEPVVRAWLTSM